MGTEGTEAAEAAEAAEGMEDADGVEGAAVCGSSAGHRRHTSVLAATSTCSSPRPEPCVPGGPGSQRWHGKAGV